MKKIAPLLLAAVMLLAACGNKNVIFQEQRLFDNNNWQRFDLQAFEIKAPNNEDCYNIYTILEIDTARVRDNALPLNINFYSPNDEHRMFQTLVNLKDRNGNYLGDFRNGYMVYEHKARANYFFNVAGLHKMEISQGSSHYDLPCVHSLTIKIEKVKIEYPE